ncbi:hypothetical protein P692DRAFT_20841392 [Suillus brevipes Sb2]|nr:hypothetical protein P692DRAFT_20841392 [Suillus brevipes Sb2]
MTLFAIALEAAVCVGLGTSSISVSGVSKALSAVTETRRGALPQHTTALVFGCENYCAILTLSHSPHEALSVVSFASDP